MKKNINTFTVMCLLFLLLLSSASVTDGALSDVIYYSAFILPTILGILCDNKLRKEESTHDREYPEAKSLFTLNKSGAIRILQFLFPTLGLIMAVSALSSALIGSLFGAVPTVDVGDDFLSALLIHALLPALLEEMLFRFMPMRMLSRHSARLTIVISSLYFALVHNSFFSIPYALLAGVIFMTLDLLSESIFPSLILHFCNNALSVVWIFLSDTPKYAVIISVSLAVLSFISVIFIIINGKRHLSELKVLLRSGDSYKIGYAPIAIAVPTVFFALSELIG